MSVFIAYKLTGEKGGEVLAYYGSTSLDLQTRLLTHLSQYKRWKNGKTPYVSSFKIIECENIKIEELGKYNSEEEVRVVEDELIRNNECVNSYCRFLGQIRYKENPKEYFKQYRELNREKIKNDARIRRAELIKEKCPCGGVFNNDNLKRHLQSKRHQAFVATSQMSAGVSPSTIQNSIENMP